MSRPSSRGSSSSRAISRSLRFNRFRSTVPWRCSGTTHPILENAAGEAESKTSKEAEVKVQELLAVLARCFQLQDAIAVLELDRVLDSSPEELDRHRLAIRAARQNRLELIARCTERLTTRMDAAAGTANTKVLLHPTTSPALVHSCGYLHEHRGSGSGAAGSH